MIVECPSCHTKFSVEETQIPGHKTPRFHCSRCGHLFETTGKTSLKSNGNLQISLKTSSTLLASSTQSSREASFDLPEDLPPTPKQLSLIPDDSSKPVASRISNKNDPLKKSALNWPSADENENFKIEWPESSLHDTYEANVGGGSTFTKIRERATATPAALLQSHTESYSLNESAIDWPEVNTELIAAPKLPGPVRVRPRDELLENLDAPILKASPKQQLLDSLDDSKPIKQRILKIPDRAKSSYVPELFTIEDNTLSEPLLDEDIFPTKPKQATEFNFRSLGICLSLTLLSLLAFIVWGLNFTKTPTWLANLVGGSEFSQPALPPLGIEVVSPKSALVTLDGGERVLEISGDIFNATPNNYRELEVEATLFDKNNKILDSHIVQSNNGLVAAKINSLKAEDLIELQSTRGGMQRELASSHRLPFRVIFKDPPKEAHWFSARVYSVKTSDQG